MRNVTGAATPQGTTFDVRGQQAILESLGCNLFNMEGEAQIQTTFSDEVQEEANTFFEQLYSPAKQLSVDDFLEKMRQYQASTVLDCVIRNLFEEYTFFHDYPARELATTAEVYGGIIRENIITSLQFATAVRKVIESLQMDPNSRLFFFGVKALNACKSKLGTYPKVCAMIMQHENFSRIPAPLAAYVRAGVGEKQPGQDGTGTPISTEISTPIPAAHPQTHVQTPAPTSQTSATAWPQTSAQPSPQPMSIPNLATAPAPSSAGPNSPSIAPVATTSTATGGTLTPQASQQNAAATAGAAGAKPPIVHARSGGPNILSMTNSETLIIATEKDGATMDKPSEDVVEKVAFLFNNLSQANLVAKKAEINSMIAEGEDKFLRWFAQYVVIRRVALEPNFHHLYNLFLQSIKNKKLDDYVKIETLRNIRILFRSNKRNAASNYSDRTLLKNLGSWLGQITIARNKAILHDELDIKSLLLEAYVKGQPELLFIVPFVAKLVMKLQVFTPVSSWIYGILKILAELHEEPDLKINLKFEIEVLTKELEVPLDELCQHCEHQLKNINDQVLYMCPQLPDVPVEDVHVQEPPPREEHEESVPVPPRFAYSDINLSSMESINHLIRIPSHPAFHMYPNLRHQVRPAILASIKELVVPVTDRALKVSMAVSERMIMKDFFYEPDDSVMRSAALNLMRGVTSGMAMITAREPVSHALMSYLSHYFYNMLRQHQCNFDDKLIDHAVSNVMLENVDLATAVVIKTACEKAMPELDRRLDPEFSLRQTFSRENREWNPSQAPIDDLPPALRERLLNPRKCMSIFEEFSARICGFRPTTVEEMMQNMTMTQGGYSVHNLPFHLDIKPEDYEKVQNTFLLIAVECDNTYRNVSVYTQIGKVGQSLIVLHNNLRQLGMSQVNPAALRNVVIQSVEHLLNGYTPSQGANKEEVDMMMRLSDLTINFLRFLVQQRYVPMSDMAQCVTYAIIHCQTEIKFNAEALEVFIRQGLILYDVFDRYMAEAIESTLNGMPALCAQRLIRLMASRGIPESQVREKFPLTLEQLCKLSGYGQNLHRVDVGTNSPHVAQQVMPPPGLPPIVQPVQQQQLEYVQPAAVEPVEFNSKDAHVEFILREWISLCYTPMTHKDPHNSLANIIHLMHQHGVLATDDMITGFFRTCIEMCIDVSYRLLKDEAPDQIHSMARQRCYYTLDAFVKLTVLMVKYSDGSQAHTKINLLRKVLNILFQLLVQDHDKHAHNFIPLPYYRMLIVMLNELMVPDPTIDAINWQLLDLFGQVFLMLQPRRSPRFAIAWLDLVGNRNVIARFLTGPPGTSPGDPFPDQERSWSTYVQILIVLLKFMAPFLRNVDLTKAITLMYKGMLRIFLVVLHDFPELFCEYHFIICDTIPANCVQLRNLVLSAYPRNMRLPDPFTLPFKQIDTLPDIVNEPKMNMDYITSLPEDFRQQLEKYFTSRANVDFIANLAPMLQTSNTAGIKYNVSKINALVLYVGMRAVETIHSKGQRISSTTIAHTSFMDIFQSLTIAMCNEGRYLLINAMANQLRFPNAHTHYFSCTLLFIFLHSDTNSIKEQITRILFERLVALRPHPWGLLITFIELIRNATYLFWEHDFTTCSPEVERLFRNVANTCVAGERALQLAQEAAAQAAAEAAAAAAGTAAVESEEGASTSQPQPQQQQLPQQQPQQPTPPQQPQQPPQPLLASAVVAGVSQINHPHGVIGH